MRGLSEVLLAVSLFPAAAAQSGLVGEQAPDFSLQDLGGKEVSLKSLRGHTVVLHFWATYWPACYADMGHLDKLYGEFKNRGVVILGINVGQLQRVVRAFVAKRSYSYPQLVNARGELILAYQATDAPAVVIIGKDGKVLTHLREDQGDERLRSALQEAIR